MNKFPYIQNQKKITNFICNRCKKECEFGFELEWRVDWFQGNCEFEKICTGCLKKYQQDKSKKLQDELKQAEQSAKKQRDFWNDMEARVRKNYNLRILTPYQWRINEVLDLYITNRKYHDLKRNKRGGYLDMHKFLAKFFKP